LGASGHGGKVARRGAGVLQTSDLEEGLLKALAFLLQRRPAVARVLLFLDEAFEDVGIW